MSRNAREKLVSHFLKMSNERGLELNLKNMNDFLSYIFYSGDSIIGVCLKNGETVGLNRRVLKISELASDDFQSKEEYLNFISESKNDASALLEEAIAKAQTVSSHGFFASPTKEKRLIEGSQNPEWDIIVTPRSL